MKHDRVPFPASGLLLSLLVTGLTVLVAGCGGPRQVTPVLDSTSGRMTVEATGRAAVRDDAASLAQGWVAAERAARVDGYRKLAEQIYGLSLQSEGTVRDAVLEDDRIRSRVESFVRHARIIDVRRDEDRMTVAVMMRIHLGNEFEEFVFR